MCRQQHKKEVKKLLRVGYKRNSSNVDEAVRELVKHKSQVRAVVLIATYKPAALFIEKVKDAGLDVIFAAVSFVDSDALVEDLVGLGPKYTSGVIVTQVVPMYLSNATGVIRFREQLSAEPRPEKPGFVSLEGYIAARILVEGLQNAGEELTSETLVDALERIRDLDLAIGPKITFGPSEHQGSHRVWGSSFNEKGEYQVLDLE